MHHFFLIDAQGLNVLQFPRPPSHNYELCYSLPTEKYEKTVEHKQKVLNDKTKILKALDS